MYAFLDEKKKKKKEKGHIVIDRYFSLFLKGFEDFSKLEANTDRPFKWERKKSFLVTSGVDRVAQKIGTHEVFNTIVSNHN